LNPTAQNHSFPSATARHVGDLGNVLVDASGAASVTFTDSVISLVPGSTGYIPGYVLMVHSGVDDGVSQPTGAAGARLGCSVIAAA
jgi:Cu-Zn family superoxide dismutase